MLQVGLQGNINRRYSFFYGGPYLENIAFIDCSLNNCIASTGFYVLNKFIILYFALRIKFQMM
ncbi:hypothetical protein ACFP3I_00230 [Chryseobacterium arachidis]|uniref:hypothetical protein n=1 Tax=Chryseobacterium arachidis TaxID=1416778 RepID=UPI0036206734